MPLLEIPADLVWVLLREVYGQAESAMDAPSFRDTKALQQAVGLKWAMAFRGMPLTEFARLAGLQGRAMLFQERGLWVYRWDGRPPAGLTFDATNTLPDVGLRARVTPSTELVTELTVKYAQDPAQGDYREAFTLRSVTADRYAARRGRASNDRQQGMLELPWVRNATAAAYIGAWRLAQLDHPRLLLTVTATWEALAVEKGDLIRCAHALLNAYGGPIAAIVRRKAYRLADDAIELEAVDAPTQTKRYGLRYVLGSKTIAKRYGLRYDIAPRQRYGLRYVMEGEAIAEEEAVPPSTNDFRLTLLSGDPVPAADQTAKTTLYLTPHIGQSLMVYAGAAWVLRTGGEVSMSLSALAANTVYDIFAFDAAGIVTLEAVAWASATARATALARQDGVYVKSGDATRRYMGTISTTATAGQCEDSLTKRYVWPAQNRVLRPLRRLDPTATWTYTTVSTWRQARADAANEVGVVLGLLAEPIGLGVYCWGWHATSNAGFAIGIGEDSTTVALTTGLAPQVGTSPSQGFTPIVARFDGWPAAIGRHRYVWLERNNTSGTLNLYGTDASASMNSGMTGTVWA
jgi:Putative phage tail protein